MKKLRFVRDIKLSLLHDQLLAADITPLLVEQDSEGATVITVEDNVQDDAVQTVVDAHDPEEQTAGEQIAQEIAAARQELAEGYQQAITTLNNIIDNADTLTANQVRTAVVNEARILRALLKFMRRTFG